MSAPFLSTMSLNATWSEYATQAQAYLPTTPRLALLGLVNLPLLIIALNVLYQLVIPKDPSLPPVVFHWLPFIGSAVAYGNDPINFLMKCREKYGNVFTFILFGRRMTVALGAKGNNFVLGGRTSHVSAEEAYTPLTTPVFGKGVVYDVPNEVLMEQKKFVKFGLSTENFRLYVDMIEEEVAGFMNSDSSFKIFQMDDINEWGSFHPFKAMSELIILTASRTLQGVEVRESLDKTFADLYHDLDGGFTPVNMIFPNLPSEANKKRDKAQKAMSDFYVDILKKRKAGDFSHEHDMLAALTQQKYKSGRELSEREIAHIMIALLMAGQHTSSTTASWALLRIAQNPEIGEMLYQEQVEHFGLGEGKFRSMTYEELKALPIMDAVIRETLRMHPPIHSIIRKIINDVPVPPTLAAPSREGGAYVIPKGYFVLCSPAVSQVDPKFWKDALEWDPQRWLDPEGFAMQAYKTYEDANGEKVDYGFGAVSKGTESEYTPFGAGRHRCIGEQFAYVQLGTIIATIVRKIEMRRDMDFPKPNYHTMIVTPKDPCDIRYRRRHFD